jgi:hypothetical protein
MNTVNRLTIEKPTTRCFNGIILALAGLPSIRFRSSDEYHWVLLEDFNGVIIEL